MKSSRTMTFDRSLMVILLYRLDVVNRDEYMAYIKHHYL